MKKMQIWNDITSFLKNEDGVGVIEVVLILVKKLTVSPRKYIN